jgi:hypothetical protein
VIYRRDAILDLIDTLTISGQVSSPVAINESSVFRRKFRSVYDALLHGELSHDYCIMYHRLIACNPQFEKFWGVLLFGI